MGAGALGRQEHGAPLNRQTPSIRNAGRRHAETISRTDRMTPRIRELDSAKAEIAAAELAAEALLEAAEKKGSRWPGYRFAIARHQRLLEEVKDLRLQFQGLLMTGD